MDPDRPETSRNIAELESGEPISSNHAGDASNVPDLEANAKETSKPEGQPNEPNKATMALVLTSVLLAMFLVALDRTIISTVRRRGSSPRN
jgi:hypothetical protein